jgi:catechol 2,3-dioxygenase-like lactoylglutathione lyase family enzyme
MPSDQAHLTSLRNGRLLATIPVRDRARAQAFYTDVLGLELEGASAAGVLLRAGAERILLFESGAPAPAHTLAGFEVDQLEAVMTGLGARGVVFEDYDYPTLRTVGQIAWIGPERAAWFHDSEGNVLSISEPWLTDPGKS